MAQTKSIGEVMKEITELEQRAAVQEAVSNYLRGRYLSRDSGAALSKINCNGAPVPEVVIEATCIDLDEGVTAMRKAADRMKGEVISG